MSELLIAIDVYKVHGLVMTKGIVGLLLRDWQNLMDGLYPPVPGGKALVVPIWLVEEAQDDMQIDFRTCPAALEQVIKTFIEHPSYIAKVLEPLIPHDLQLKKIFNTSRPNIAALKNYDNCNCRVHHSIPLPNGMSQRIFDDIQKSYWFAGEVIFNSTAAMTLGPFAQELLGFMQEKVSSPGRLQTGH